MNNKIKIEIHVEKDYAWCELNGQFIYGKNEAEVRSALDQLNNHYRPGETGVRAAV